MVTFATIHHNGLYNNLITFEYFIVYVACKSAIQILSKLMFEIILYI